jgi:PAS domain S-box-containing protein
VIEHVPRVLIVEDEAVIALDLEARLGRMGYAVAGVVDTAEGAVSAVAAEAPALVLMDVRLRGARDGIDAAQEIHRRFDAPVVFVTAHADEATLERARAAEPAGFVVKPFEDGQLRAALELALEQSERRTRAVEARMRAVLDAAPDGILAAAGDGRISLANPAAEELLGYERGDLIGRSIEELVPVHARTGHAGKRVGFMGTGGKRPMGLGLPLCALHRDGSEIPVDIGLSRAGEGAGALVVAVVRDLRARRALEARAEKAELALAQSQKLEALGRLAGGMAHDLNNLLTTIQCSTAFLLDELAQGSAPREDVQEIERAAGSAAELIRQLLAFARQQMVEPKVVDVNAIIQEKRGLFERLLDESVTLELGLASDLGSVRVDPVQLEQVLMNLCANARDAMPRGGTLSVETANVDLDQERAERHGVVLPGPHVMIVVTDTGEGMSPETRQRIFEPFFTTKELGRGTGLGLATVYGIVTQAGGSIAVYSEPGLGTAFKIFLPHTQAAPRASTPRPPSVAPEQVAHTVLVVEDSDALRRAVVRGLVRAGFTVLDAPDAERAMELAESSTATVSLLLTDVIMPGIGGRALSERLRARRPGLKVLFMSGYTETAALGMGVVEAGEHFLHKPFSPAELVSRVREVLDDE